MSSATTSVSSTPEQIIEKSKNNHEHHNLSSNNDNDNDDVDIKNNYKHDKKSILSQVYPVDNPAILQEVSNLSTKLIHAVERQSDLEDLLSKTRNELNIAKQHIQSLDEKNKEYQLKLKNGFLIDKQDVEAETNKLLEKLKKESQERTKAEQVKNNIESELENLSASLFEEANKMVVTARKEKDQLEKKNEQLQILIKEKDVLFNSMQEQLSELKQVLQKFAVEKAEYNEARRASVSGGLASSWINKNESAPPPLSFNQLHVDENDLKSQGLVPFPSTGSDSLSDDNNLAKMTTNNNISNDTGSVDGSTNPNANSNANTNSNPPLNGLSSIPSALSTTSSLMPNRRSGTPGSLTGINSNNNTRPPSCLKENLTATPAFPTFFSNLIQPVLRFDIPEFYEFLQLVPNNSSTQMQLPASSTPFYQQDSQQDLPPSHSNQSESVTSKISAGEGLIRTGLGLVRSNSSLTFPSFYNSNHSNNNNNNNNNNLDPISDLGTNNENINKRNSIAVDHIGPPPSPKLIYGKDKQTSTISSFISSNTASFSASNTIMTLKDTRFFKRVMMEDIEPTIRLDIAPRLTYFSRKYVLSSILDGSLVINPILNDSGISNVPSTTSYSTNSSSEQVNNNGNSNNNSRSKGSFESARSEISEVNNGNVAERSGNNNTNSNSGNSGENGISLVSSRSGIPIVGASPFPCSLCGEQRDDEPHLRRHYMCTSDHKSYQNKYYLCAYCLARVRAVCNFAGFLRAIRGGLWKIDSAEDQKRAWEECVRLREQMFWTRIGGGVVPVAN